MAEQTVQGKGAQGLPQLPDGVASTIAGGIAAGTIPLPNITGGAAAPSGSEGLYSNRSPINIAPVGVNLGAILQPFEQGSPENGGYGLDLMSRYIEGKYGARQTAVSTPVEPGGNQSLLIAAAIGGVMLLIILYKKGG